jgi:hypothetical protein
MCTSENKIALLFRGFTKLYGDPGKKEYNVRESTVKQKWCRLIR